MICPLLGNRSAAARAMLGAQSGVLTLEALLVLPVLFLVALFFVGLMQAGTELLQVDQALSAAARELADQAYTLQQGLELALGEGGEFVSVPDSLAQVWVKDCLEKQGLNLEIMSEALVWDKIVLPQGGTGEDVILSLKFWPAKVKSTVATLLPKGLCFEVTRRERAWLIGRELLPYRGLEQSVDTKKTGTLVFITRWGTRYHQAGCRYLAKSKIPFYLNELAPNYVPCTRCQPPNP